MTSNAKEMKALSLPSVTEQFKEIVLNEAKENLDFSEKKKNEHTVRLSAFEQAEKAKI